jgi:hypothetical protein
VKFAFERAIPLGARASSGLPVAYAVLDGQCELQGASSALLTGAGFCAVEARQPGSAQWLPAPSVQVRFDIVNGDSDFQLQAPASVAASAGVVTLNLTNVIGSDSFTASGEGACPDFTEPTGQGTFDLALDGNPGTCTVTVNQNGTQDFNIGPTRTATITVT